jgi:mycofactocin glycosyltransferase
MNLPALDAPHRYDPVYVTDDDIADLATFVGMSPEDCRTRLRAYAPAELAEEWRRAGPMIQEDPTRFYRATDLYVWDLMQWHASAARRPYWQALDYLTRHLTPSDERIRVYDFGCGVGTDALFLASRGYDVTLVDVDGPTFNFAKHRFARRGLKARFIESRSDLPEPDTTYDAVLCFDVLEHLPNPEAAVRRLVSALKPGGFLLQQGTFEDDGEHPCHLTEGIRRFGGLRWHIHLAGLGLKREMGLVYGKTARVERVVQLLRFGVWRATGLWVVRSGRIP